MTERKQQLLHNEAANKQKTKYIHQRTWASDTGGFIDERLKREEEKAKIILDKKIDAT